MSRTLTENMQTSGLLDAACGFLGKTGTEAAILRTIRSRIRARRKPAEPQSAPTPTGGLNPPETAPPPGFEPAPGQREQIGCPCEGATFPPHSTLRPLERSRSRVERSECQPPQTLRPVEPSCGQREGNRPPSNPTPPPTGIESLLTVTNHRPARTEPFPGGAVHVPLAGASGNAGSSGMRSGGPPKSIGR